MKQGLLIPLLQRMQEGMFLSRLWRIKSMETIKERIHLLLPFPLLQEIALPSQHHFNASRIALFISFPTHPTKHSEHAWSD